MIWSYLSLLSLIAFFDNVASHPAFSGKLIERSTDLSPSYDYIIVGGGTSGLVVANRLSENPNTTILVIEAGNFHKNEDFITIPLLTTANIPVLGTGPRKSIYDWNTTSVPQAHALNRSISLNAGKVIGGSSAINGMVFMRGNAVEYDHWAELGNSGWDWEGLLPYFKKSEHFAPADEEEIEEWGVGYEADVHGEGGFVQNGFSKFFWPSTRSFLHAFLELGVPLLKDSLSGLNTGVYFFLLSIALITQERSTSQSFLPPSSNLTFRPNLHILPSHTVTKVLFSLPYNYSYSNSREPRAIGVEYAASVSRTRYVVKARKEVILSTGAQRTPQLLQISGIGKRDFLEKLGIEVVVESEGVGENYQDHLILTTFGAAPNIGVQTGNFSTNATWAAEMRKLYDEKREGPFTTVSANVLSFLPLATIISSTSPSSIQTLQSLTHTNLTQYLLPSVPPSVLAGYALQYRILSSNLLSTNTAHMEFIVGDTIVAPCNQLPFSRGRVSISSSSSFDPPVLNPNYLSHPIDLLQFVLAFNYTRVLRNTASLRSISITETYPGPDTKTQADIETFIRGHVGSEHHHSGTASMLPRNLGGVVDEKLRVYGVKGLRVVDASVVPMLVAAHLQATVYGVAEKGAAIILGEE